MSDPKIPGEAAPVLPPPPAAARLFAVAGGCALFLDIDGTLLALQDDPAAVRADPALLNLLDRLADRLGGALALVSGRDLSGIDRITAPQRYAAAGSHGAELRLIGGPLLSGGPDDADRAARLADMLENLCRDGGCDGGVRVERKTLSAALHYRGRPDLQPQAEEYAAAALAALGDGYRLKPGKDVVEIAPADADKGRAVDLLSAHTPFIRRMPLFIGDDVTDEDGFAAARRAGGVAIRIGAPVPSPPTAAQFMLPTPAALHDWLAAGLSSPIPHETIP